MEHKLLLYSSETMAQLPSEPSIDDITTSFVVIFLLALPGNSSPNAIVHPVIVRLYQYLKVQRIGIRFLLQD